MHEILRGKVEHCGEGTPKHQRLLASPSCPGCHPQPQTFLGPTMPISRAEMDQLSKCATRSWCWEDSEGFLEAVTLSRALKSLFIHSLNEYRRPLCTRPLGPCGLVLPISAKLLGSLSPRVRRLNNHYWVQGLDKDPYSLRLTPVSARAGARMANSHYGPSLHTAGARLATARSAAPVAARAGGRARTTSPSMPPAAPERGEARLGESELHSKYLY